MPGGNGGLCESVLETGPAMKESLRSRRRAQSREQLMDYYYLISPRDRAIRVDLRRALAVLGA